VLYRRPRESRIAELSVDRRPDAEFIANHAGHSLTSGAVKRD